MSSDGAIGGASMPDEEKKRELIKAYLLVLLKEIVKQRKDRVQ
jgi:hypothetical protein